ncbi:MAG: hypothetical protein DME46_12600, partial [Verrucomicrobia bacterium]
VTVLKWRLVQCSQEKVAVDAAGICWVRNRTSMFLIPLILEMRERRSLCAQFAKKVSRSFPRISQAVADAR